MKRGSLKHLAERAVHDAHSSLRQPPAIVTSAEEAGDEQEVLIEAGGASVALEDESLFHGVELIPSLTRWRRTCCHVLRDARMVGDQGHIFNREGQFINLCPSYGRLDPAKIRHPIRMLAKTVKEPAFHLTGRDHENHGHFLMQHLPRFMAAKAFLERRGIRPAILVAPGHEKWQGRYLGTLGEIGQKVMRCRAGTLAVDELYYVPMLGDSSYLGPPQFYQQAQAAFRAFAEVDDTVPPSGRPIFVTRQDAPTRRLSNEAEIIDICRRQFGEIDVMNLAKTPFVEQIRRFAASPLVIGPQGQGLTNILFSRGTRMLILEAGRSPLSLGWANAYRDFAHMAGNSALRLFSGLAWPDDGDWPFPTEEFTRQLQRVVSLGLHHHRASAIL